LYASFIRFREAVAPRIAAPEEKFTKIDTQYQELIRQWGEDPDQLPIGDFFGIFVNLIEALKRAKDANDQRRADKEAARQKRVQPPRPDIPRRPAMGEGDAERGEIDRLKKSLALSGMPRKLAPRMDAVRKPESDEES
jgi:hypothetical protein